MGTAVGFCSPNSGSGWECDGLSRVKSQLVELLELVAGAGDQVLSVGDGLWESWRLVVTRVGKEGKSGRMKVDWCWQ